MIHFWSRLLTGLLLVFTFESPLYAGEIASSEYPLLAAFIFNIAKFTEFQGNRVKLNEPSGIFHFSVLENDDLQQTLSKLSQGKTINNHPTEVSSVDLTHLRQDSGNIIVLIPKEHPLDASTLKGLNGCQCLTVTYQKGMGEQGSIINFFIEENRFKFEINLKKAALEHITLSSQLLKLGRIIE